MEGEGVRRVDSLRKSVLGEEGFRKEELAMKNIRDEASKQESNDNSHSPQRSKN